MQHNCKCGSSSYYTKQNGPHTTAYCSGCDSYIKNIATSKPAFYIGKYKGTIIEEVNDLGYLKWARENMTSLNPRQLEAVIARIHSLTEMLR